MRAVVQRVSQASVSVEGQTVGSIGVGLCALLGVCLRAGAHPIVSTDINRHVSIHVADRALEIRYVYEMLEIAATMESAAWRKRTA